MPRNESDYDVIVAGGGAGGVGAAIGAAKAGARVALVEKYGFLGGA
ncbi:FAD-dependent oxidoreductase, partial [Pseudooceanicola nanhaiensis]